LRPVFDVAKAADRFSPAIAQYDLWIQNHPDDSKAISDFDATLKLLPKSALALYGRGIAKTRTNNAAAGEADIADAVKIAPNLEEQFTKRGITP
jgi:hypothetical protein